jgi:hypothetical protein
MKSRCPVCMYPDMPYPPKDYHICPCCGTEFGNDDAFYSHDQLRRAWAESGAPWFFGDPPPLWNPWTQLENAHYSHEIPWLHGIRIQVTVLNISVKKILRGDPLRVTMQTS